MKTLLQFVLIIFLINNSISITLDGLWSGKITTAKPEHDIEFSATVPGGIYTDLNKLNLIPNNFVGYNDVNNRWVGNQSVVYSKNFFVNDTLASVSRVLLIFHGVDTFATIFLNGQVVGETSNMFLKYTFDVSKYLRPGENLLNVSFSSPVKVAESLYNEQALNYTVPPICVPSNYNGECHVNHIRKMQASFAWDWGPAFPSMGIWKNVELIPIDDVEIMSITTDILKKGNFWNIMITVFLEVSSEESSAICHTSAVLKTNEHLHVSNSSIINIKMGGKHINSTIFLQVSTDAVEQWWPNGHGSQVLYPLTVTAAIGANIKRKIIRIGFRTVKLVQQPLQRGLSFYFEINGVPIFAKGSNYIPASVFPELSTNMDTVKHLLMSVKDANMNMLRVWGGGLYESELFYNIADEYGIMIWQDFMFACGMYPTTEQFLESVRAEVVQNVQRLKNHPSIVLWAGNNENEAALYGNWYGTGTNQIYKSDYIKLYVNVIKEEVERLDATRPFTVSSPSNGLHTEEYNYIGEDPYSTFYGDVHYYNYFANGWDMNQYPRARFSSEYGFQSLPSLYTLLPVIRNTTDLNIYSDFMKHRQHLPLGTQYLKSLILRNFRIPKAQDNVNDFANIIYLSQINQAVSIKMQTEFYRQQMSELNELGEGMTMGALYWQLNDVWQAPSWSSIDFYGRWKMLHYYAVEFFAPVIVTYYVKDTDFTIYIVSDKLSAIENTTLDVNLYELNNMTPMQSYAYHNIQVEPNTVTKIHDSMLQHTLNIYQFNITAQNNCITTLTLKDKAGFQIAPRNYIYPRNTFKDVALPSARISVQVNSYDSPSRYFGYPDIELELTTDNISLFVWLEAGNVCGRFSENGFHMFERKKNVTFLACEIVTPKALKRNLKISTLADIYNVNE